MRHLDRGKTSSMSNCSALPYELRLPLIWFASPEPISEHLMRGGAVSPLAPVSHFGISF